MYSLFSTPPSQRAGVPTDTPLQRTLREQQILLDSAGVGIVFLRQRSVVRCNQRYAEIFGYASPAHLVGLNTEAFYPDRDASGTSGAPPILRWPRDNPSGLNASCVARTARCSGAA